MDRQTAKAIQKRAAEALRGSLAGFKVEVESTAATYSETYLKLSVVLVEQTEDGQPVGPQAESFLNHARIGYFEEEALTEADLGAEFRDPKGNLYRLVGYNARARKQPFVAERLEPPAGHNVRFAFGSPTRLRKAIDARRAERARD